MTLTLGGSEAQESKVSCNGSVRLLKHHSVASSPLAIAAKDCSVHWLNRIPHDQVILATGSASHLSHPERQPPCR